MPLRGLVGRQWRHPLGLQPPVELRPVDVDSTADLDQRRLQSIPVGMEYPPAQLCFRQEDGFIGELLNGSQLTAVSYGYLLSLPAS